MWRGGRKMEHESCSLFFGRTGYVTRRAPSEFAIWNPEGGFVSGCSEHAFLMLLGCFHSCSAQSWVPLPQGALNLSWYLQQSSYAPSPPCCSHFTSAVNTNLELPSFPVTVGLLLMFPKWKSLPILMKKFSLCPHYTHLMSGRPCSRWLLNFLPCTALCLQSTGLFLHRASHLLGTALWFCIALYVEGSYTVVVIITGMQIYYLVFSNLVGAHVYLVHLSAVFK